MKPLSFEYDGCRRVWQEPGESGFPLSGARTAGRHRDCTAEVTTTFGIGVQLPAPETAVDVHGAAAVLVTVSVPAVTMPNTA